MPTHSNRLETYFQSKIEESAAPSLVFNNSNVFQCKSQHLGITLDSKGTFEEHYKTVLSKTNRVNHRTFTQAPKFAARRSINNSFKAFVRPHLDYGDAVFDPAFHTSSHEKLESRQYNACLALTGTIRGTSKGNYIKNQIRISVVGTKSFVFYKIFKNKSPVYLFNIIPARNTHSLLTNNSKACFSTKQNVFKNSFFLSTIIE